MKYSIKNLNQFVPFKFIGLIRNRIQIFFVIILSILACGNKSDKVLQDKQYLEQQAATNVDCLEKFHGKPEELLSKDLVGNFVDFEGADVDVAKVSEQIIRDEDFAQVNCKWKIGRQRRIIRLSKIFKIKLYKSKTSVDRFYAKYHTRTPQEQEELKKCYDSLVLNSKTIKQKTDKSNAEILSESVGFDYAYLNIDAIGDAAVWEYKINDLIVLVGDYQFTVNVDLNKGNDYDLEKAKLIAKAIIEKACN